MSWREGHPFNCRHGVRCNVDNEAIGVITLTVQRMLHKWGIDWKALGWEHVVR